MGFLNEEHRVPAAAVEYWGVKKAHAEFISAQNTVYVIVTFS